MNIDFTQLSLGLELGIAVVLVVSALFILPILKKFIEAHKQNQDLQKIAFWANQVVEEARALGLVVWGQKFEKQLLDDLTTKLDSYLLSHGIDLQLDQLETLILKELGNPNSVTFQPTQVIASPNEKVTIEPQPVG